MSLLQANVETIKLYITIEFNKKKKKKKKNNYIVISDISDDFPLISLINMLKPNEQTDVGLYRCFSPRNMKLFKDAVDINYFILLTLPALKMLTRNYIVR